MTTDAWWDVASVTAVGVLTLAALVRHGIGLFNRKTAPGCKGGCACASSCKPDARNTDTHCS